MRVEDALDRLFAAPPSEFTATRNELAKQLRHEGDAAAAGRVKALPRPPVAIWALNQLTRDDPKLVGRFLKASAALRKAQDEGGDIRAAAARYRPVETLVVAAAEQLVRSQGRKPTDTVMRRLRKTIRAAAASEGAAEVLAGGRMTEELEPPPATELLARMKPRSKAARRRAAAARTRVDERETTRRELGEARTKAAEARLAAREANAEEKRLRKEWEQAKARAKRADAALGKAADLVDALQAELRSLRER